MENVHLEDYVGFLASPHFIASVIVALVAIAIVLAMGHLGRKYRKKIKGSDLHGTKRDRVIRAAQVTIRYIVIILAIVVILQINGINIAGLAAGLGVVGIIVGFALQDILSDVAMDVRIVTDNYFTMGDVIRYKEFEGEIVAMSPQSTKIHSIIDDSVMTISNRHLSEVVFVATLNDIDVPIESYVPLEDIDAVFEEIVPRVLKLPHVKRAAYVGIQNYSDCWIDHRFRFFCHPKWKYQNLRDTKRIIMEELSKKGIGIGGASMDVNVRHVD